MILNKNHALVFILIVSTSVVAKEIDLPPISLKCIGVMTETYKDYPTKTYENIVRHYELSQNKVVEHIGTITFEHTRKEIEAGNDNIRKHSGYYTYKPLMIVYSEDISYGESDITNRMFLIDRQTTKWEVTEFGSGGILALSGLPSKLTNINGYCEPWDNRAKF
ncbi:hypothetical protein [Polynucleobacter rarus]|uniref:hypothetical protein n=1 Tax=Polynucleobacter rarus TaxID=556055 RepID=UPI000D3E5DA9|nr:hypothetical protein [Polynucleobacter rarus]